ncbi:hypothetical protein NK639_06150 [Pseudomonas sp. ZM24]|nr:hypothetical protein [Pseudomonas triclosanedens]MCP8475128.1 hypothetical protein [Pseudomonas triclosanedens]
MLHASGEQPVRRRVAGASVGRIAALDAFMQRTLQVSGCTNAAARQATEGRQSVAWATQYWLVDIF